MKNYNKYIKYKKKYLKLKKLMYGSGSKKSKQEDSKTNPVKDDSSKSSAKPNYMSSTSKNKQVEKEKDSKQKESKTNPIKSDSPKSSQDPHYMAPTISSINKQVEKKEDKKDSSSFITKFSNLKEELTKDFPKALESISDEFPSLGLNDIVSFLGFISTLEEVSTQLPTIIDNVKVIKEIKFTNGPQGIETELGSKISANTSQYSLICSIPDNLIKSLQKLLINCISLVPKIGHDMGIKIKKELKGIIIDYQYFTKMFNKLDPMIQNFLINPSSLKDAIKSNIDSKLNEIITTIPNKFISVIKIFVPFPISIVAIPIITPIINAISGIIVDKLSSEIKTKIDIIMLNFEKPLGELQTLIALFCSILYVKSKCKELNIQPLQIPLQIPL